MVTAERRTVTVAQAAAILSIGRSAAYEAVHRGDIPTLRIGRRLVVPMNALDRMLGGVGGPDRHDSAA